MNEEDLVKIGEASSKLFSIWSSNGDGHLCVNLMDGKRPSISRDRFRAIYHTLSLMRCWAPEEALAPWTTRVLYKLPPHALEVEPMWPDDVHVFVETDERASTISTYVYKDHETQVNGATVHVREFDPRKVYIRPGKHHQDIEMQQFKRFTFQSSFTWQYECIVSYKDPFISPDGKTMAFTNPPFYQVSLRCLSTTDHKRDAVYLVHSLVAKLRDLGVTARV